MHGMLMIIYTFWNNVTLHKKILFFIFFVNFLCITQNVASEKPLKILFILPKFPASSATFIINQITGLIDKGHDVYIFAQQKNYEKKIHPDIQNYNLSERTCYRFLPKNLLSYDILYCQFFLLAKKMLPEFERLKKISPDKPKIVLCCRGSDGIENVVIQKKIFQSLFNNIDLFLPVCEHFKSYLVQAGCDFNKIKVHHSAIDLTIFQYKKRELPQEEIILLSIGRLVETKGHEYSIRAFAQLEKEFPTLKYMIIGDGPLREKLEELIKQYGLTDKISLPGWFPRDEIVKWLNNAHIFVHPSITSSGNCQEGIPNVLMEAMATGLPIIGTNHGGIPELVEDGISGFLVPEKNICLLAEKIRYLIKNNTLWKQMGFMGRIKVKKNHHIDEKNNELQNIFNNIFHF